MIKHLAHFFDTCGEKVMNTINMKDGIPEVPEAPYRFKYPYREYMLPKKLEAGELFNIITDDGTEAEFHWAILCYLSEENYGMGFVTACCNDQFVELQDALAQLENAGPMHCFFPFVGAVVLAKCNPIVTALGSTSSVQRGVIRQIARCNHAIIHFIDIGMYDVIKIKSLMSATDAIMKFPVLGQTVRLKNVQIDESNKLFFRAGFGNIARFVGETAVKIVSIETIKEVVEVSVKVDVRRLFPTHRNRKKSVIYQSGGQRIKRAICPFKDLSKLINDLQIWEWEEQLERHSLQGKSDLDICEMLHGGRLRFVDCYPEVKTVKEPEELADDRVCLARQIDKYIKHLEDHKVKNNHFPTKEEAFLILVEGEVNKDDIPCVGKWTRCCRGSLGWLTDLETGKQFPFDPEECPKLKGVVKYNFRPCPREFIFCVPVGLPPLPPEGHCTEDEAEEDNSAGPLTDDEAEEDNSAGPLTDDEAEEDNSAGHLTDDEAEEDNSAGHLTDDEAEEDNSAGHLTDDEAEEDNSAGHLTDDEDEAEEDD